MSYFSLRANFAIKICLNKKKKKNADPLYPEMPGQWQDFNFPDEEFLQPAMAKAEKFH